MKRLLIALLVILSCSVTACDKKNGKTETLNLAAAASLKTCFENDIIPLFKEKNQNMNVEATYDSSGKLQTQIEEGAHVDVFISAAEKQMNELDKKGLIAENSIVPLLENKLVLIVPNGNEKNIKEFGDMPGLDTIAIGDPDSVPAGQYAKEMFINLGLWDDILKKSSLGSNVTEVLNWVSEGSADAGIVYATDAKLKDNVEIVLYAPEGSVSKVIYPAGIVKADDNYEKSKLFMDFLKSSEVKSIFEKYGFDVYVD